jgi:hypothetical protein
MEPLAIALLKRIIVAADDGNMFVYVGLDQHHNRLQCPLRQGYPGRFRESAGVFPLRLPGWTIDGRLQRW